MPRDTEQRTHSKELANSFKPIRIFLHAIGQLPFSIRQRSDGVFAFKFRKKSLSALAFAISTVVFSFTYIMITVGLLSLFFHDGRQGVHNITVLRLPIVSELTKPQQIPWEQAMVANNLAAVIITYCFLTTTFFGNMYILLHGNQYVHYCNYWMRVVQVMDMDTTEGVRVYLVREIIVFIVVAIGETISFTSVVGVRATSGIYTCLILRYFISDLPSRPYFNIAQVVGFIVILYGQFGSRALVIQFMYFAQLLKNAAKVWNNRLRYALDAYVHESPEEIRKKRHEFRTLLKDHYVIVQLFKMTEGTFALILQVFYLGQFLSLLFECFYLWKLIGPAASLSVSVFQRNLSINSFRPKIPPKLKVLSVDEAYEEDHVVSESIITMVLLLQTLATSYLTAAVGHAAYKEAMKGFQIVRKRGLILCQTKTERNFIHTLIVSFGRAIPIVLTADGYFVINKPFVIGIIATVAAYFVPLIQLDITRYLIRMDDYRMNWGPRLTDDTIPIHINI